MELKLESLLISAASELGLELKPHQVKQFLEYKIALLEWNKKINLTAITDDREIIIKHFVDSLTCAKYVNEGYSLIDVGTGAGFPGIPLKILFGDKIQLTLVDSLNKRVNFLNQAIEELKLDGVNAVHARVEDVAYDEIHRGKYDIAVSRAVAKLAVLAEYCLPFVKVGGVMLSMKGSNADEEITDAAKAVELLGGKIEKVEMLTLPYSDINHSIIVIRKTSITPKGYPRKAGIPEKNPIK